MTTFSLDKGATLGAKMKSDGTVYRPDRNGRIHVENRRHINELRSSNAKNEYALVAESIMPVGPNLPDNYCDSTDGCMLNNLVYRSTCARCGMELSKRTSSDGMELQHRATIDTEES
jgi:hypothetical protein